jgi:beta-N-acetylhexosaminidase
MQQEIDSMAIGQMFLVGFDGCTVDSSHWLFEAVTAEQLGGVILFDRNVDGAVQNIQSPAQLQDLTGQLQAISAEPLLIAVDQEGGQVCRLKERDGFAPSRSAADLGRQAADQSTFPAAAAMAVQLAENGINLNLAPVLDLDLNPDNPIIGRYERSFGSSTEQVAAHARAFIKAHHQQGVGCCLKHFPGHGSAGADSHLGFVDISDQWQEEELEPYKRLFAAGFTDAVMTAHLVHYGLDPTGLPATLSPIMINSLLRDTLGFNGLVMTDDLQMKAITGCYGFRDAVQRAVLAGVDMMIVGNNLLRSKDALTRGIAAIRELLDQGRIDPARIRASLARIAEFKEKICCGFEQQYADYEQ